MILKLSNKKKVLGLSLSVFMAVIIYVLSLYISFFIVYFIGFVLYFISFYKTSADKILESTFWMVELTSKIFGYLESKIKHRTRKHADDIEEVLFLDNSIRFFSNNKLHNDKEVAVIYPITSRKICEYWLDGVRQYPENLSSFKKLVKNHKEQKIIKNKLKEF
jgi:hypothetical protein